mgnify:CR=1 FL=1
MFENLQQTDAVKSVFSFLSVFEFEAIVGR